MRTNCPKCPPFKAPSLSIDQSRGLFHCFRCGYSGKTKAMYRVYDNGPTSSGKCEWPEYFEPLNPYEPKDLAQKFALKYLFNRNVSKEQVLKYKMGFCRKGKYENRVIVPFLAQKELIYFVARSIKKNALRKYLNPPVPKGSLVFKTFLGKVQVAAIVEGVFDALNVEHSLPAIAMLGKAPTTGQINHIRDCAETVVVMLDSDAVKDAFGLEQQLSYHLPTKRVLLDHGDPGTLSRKELHEHLRAVS